MPPGAAIGLGSGRAVWAVIDAIRERFGPSPPLRAVVASSRTHEAALAAGIEIVELDGELELELALDGADEIDPQLGLIKGGGAALLREKLVVAAAKRFVVVAEVGKRVERLGTTHPLPVEIVRFAWQDTGRRLLRLVPDAELRTAGNGDPVVTDEGHHLLDCRLPETPNLPQLAVALKAETGVVEHGLFLDLADLALLGTPAGDVEELRAGRGS